LLANLLLWRVFMSQLPESSNMSANPVLVEVIRGDAVESVHRGRAVIVRSSGETLWSVGDVNALTYPRSAIKAFQALPMVASGAANAFGFTPAELALTCASHNGESFHTETALGMLAKLGLEEPALECGHHWPMGQQALIDLAWQHQQPGAQHNNCSGKHAGMLALARHMGWDTQGYIEVDHPVQVAIRECIETCCDTQLDGVPMAPDGCSVPTWAMPLKNLALGFARFGDPDQLPGNYQQAAHQLYDAAVSEPMMVAGTGRYCSEVMADLTGRAFLKVGAEGVYIAAIPELNVGIALKMDTGSAPAAEMAMTAILGRLGLPVSAARKVPEIRNWNGRLTGYWKAVDDSFSSLSPLSRRVSL
jgi:L-asparaginase II